MHAQGPLAPVCSEYLPAAQGWATLSRAAAPSSVQYTCPQRYCWHSWKECNPDTGNVAAAYACGAPVNNDIAGILRKNATQMAAKSWRLTGCKGWSSRLPASSSPRRTGCRRGRNLRRGCWSSGRRHSPCCGPNSRSVFGRFATTFFSRNHAQGLTIRRRKRRPRLWRRYPRRS